MLSKEKEVTNFSYALQKKKKSSSKGIFFGYFSINLAFYTLMHYQNWYLKKATI